MNEQNVVYPFNGMGKELIHVTTLMNLNGRKKLDIKEYLYMIPFILILENINLIYGNRNRSVVIYNWGCAVRTAKAHKTDF